METDSDPYYVDRVAEAAGRSLAAQDCAGPPDMLSIRWLDPCAVDCWRQGPPAAVGMSRMWYSSTIG